MVLAAGVRLGPYEVLAPLGAGGMGEVYRARDTRLGREVAVKVLPGDVSSSGEWRKRFEREAKAISKLAHPHVCALFDVGSEGDVDYLVMELLSGVTLAARVAKGPLPFEEVLRFGVEMASALAATHAVGIAHGDLKPSNVMVTTSGIKLLDYGVAKPLAPPRSGARDSMWASTVSQLRKPSPEVVGTFPYMAPEQFDGKGADASTDIFALGAVLFELATGKRAFPGNSSAEVMSAVLNSEPPLVSSLQPASSPAFDRLVATCLAKKLDSRCNSAHDVGLVLRQLQQSPSDKPPASSARGRRVWLPWGVALAALCAVAALMLRPAREGTASGGPIRFVLTPPPGGTFFWSHEADSLAVSPDGSKVAYVAVTSGGGQRLWVRRMDDLDARPLPTTEGASSIFWSPDGRSIGFFAQGMLKRIDLPQGGAVSLCAVDSDVGLAGSWGTAGDILFGSGGRILRVPASGGTPSVAAEPNNARDDFFRWPWFLPDGEHFLFTNRRGDGRFLLMASPGRAPQELMAVGSKVQFAEPGFLVFAREGRLLAQRFDWRKARLMGAPFAIAQEVRAFVSNGSADFATSLSGTLVLQVADDAQRLVLLDRSGHELGTLAGAGSYFDFAISPSGEKVAFSRKMPGLGTSDVWSVDVERGVETRLTSAIGNELNPLWLPGEKALVYGSNEAGWPHLVRRDLVTGKDAELLPVRNWQIAEDVSPDGSSLIYTESGAVWALSLSGGGLPSQVMPPGFNIYNVRFSPDGKYIAFISDESGEAEAYVTPYPGPGQKVRISTGGAVNLRWNRGSAAIFYTDRDLQLWSVPVSTRPELRIGTPAALFKTKSLGPGIRRDAERPSFDVFPDGKRILVAVPVVIANDSPLRVVVNWPAAAPN
jgi:eukaryotic-like serine/threonine-protein kinase